MLEVSLDALEAAATLVPQHEPTPIFPGVGRDLSLIVPLRTTWASIEAAVRAGADATFEGMTYLDSFRGAPLAADEQSIHFALRFRNPAKTMTGDEIDAALNRIIARCRDQLGATLRT